MRAASTTKAAGNSSYSSVVQASGPLAYYQLNDTGSVLTDSGHFAINGTYGADVNHTAAPITLGSTTAAGFPGGSAYDANGYAYTAPNANLQPANLTLESWILCSAGNLSGQDLPIAVYGTQNVGVRYGMFLHRLSDTQSSLLYIQTNVGQAKSLLVYGSIRLNVGVAYHLVAVSDGSSVTTYVNGIADKTVAYPGAINYNAPIQTGIQIGNSKQSGNGSPSFPGTIAQVAVYGSALPASTVVNHFLAGQMVAQKTEVPTRSDTFVDSIGVNAHFENQHSAYGTQFPQVASLLINSGIRHVRVGINVNNQGYHANMIQLAASGIHGNYVTSLSESKDTVLGFAGLVSPSLESYEAPNEQDDQNNPTWLTDCRTYQQELYSWVKGNAPTANIPVLGPSLVNGNSFTALGDVSAYLDYANIHDYFGSINPGTPGWGSTTPYGVYGSIPYNMNLAKVTSGSKPVIATESGFGTSPINPGDVDTRTDLRYLTRLFFEQFNGGIVRTYSYDFIDDGGTGTYSNFGMLAGDLTPKPAYTAVSGIIKSLADPGPTFPVTPLTYSLSGFTNNVHHLLLQKRNGHYILALWIEAQGWNPNGGGDIVVNPQSVTFATPTHFSAGTLSTMDENGNLSKTSLTGNGQATFQVTDKISLLELTP